MMQLIRPYGDSVARSMSEVLGTNAATLEKKQPSGSLGNFMTDAVLAMAAKQHTELPGRKRLARFIAKR